MKITMYELLGMIKDSKAPKRIKSEGHYYNYNEIEKDYYEDMCYHYEYLFKNTPNDRLNDTVEIIEEEKKIPEKLKSLNKVDNVPNLVEFADKQQLNNHLLKDKINEVLDYLKSKGE